MAIHNVNTDKIEGGPIDRQYSSLTPIGLKPYILKFLADATSKVTPMDLEKTLARKFCIRRKAIRTIIRRMISENLIAYTYDFGRTFIEISYNKPVRIGHTVILKPPGITYAPLNDHDIIIELFQGESFGTGRHPTTRLALTAMEYILRRMEFFNETEKRSALDIGTGSGVLAIAAIKMGFKNAAGTEIDACACNEARKNIHLNGLDDKITLSLQYQPAMDFKYALITANLRYPTLKQLYPLIHRLLQPKSAIVLSGIKDSEVQRIQDVYGRHDFKCIWQSLEKEWAGLVFIRTDAGKIDS